MPDIKEAKPSIQESIEESGKEPNSFSSGQMLVLEAYGVDTADPTLKNNPFVNRFLSQLEATSNMKLSYYSDAAKAEFSTAVKSSVESIEKTLLPRIQHASKPSDTSYLPQLMISTDK